MSFNLKTKNSNSDENDKSDPGTIIGLQLGDIIKIIDPINQILNEQTFFIDYIDLTKIKFSPQIQATSNDNTICLNGMFIRNQLSNEGYSLFIVVYFLTALFIMAWAHGSTHACKQPFEI